MFPDIEGPVHRYMDSSAGCWAKYGEILAREYSDPVFFETHRLTVDVYAAQHPRSKSRQNIQSVGLHLVRICLLLEHGLDAENANEAMLEAGKNKASFTFLTPPADLGAITVENFSAAKTTEQHITLVREWAKCVWDAWEIHHDTIRTWLPNKYT